MSNKSELNDYDLVDDSDVLDDDIAMSDTDDAELDKALAKNSDKQGLLKRRKIDELLEKRRLERELREEFDDFDDNFDDDWEDD